LDEGYKKKHQLNQNLAQPFFRSSYYSSQYVMGQILSAVFYIFVSVLILFLSVCSSVKPFFLSFFWSRKALHPRQRSVPCAHKLLNWFKNQNFWQKNYDYPS
jgi:hypothetical protein